MILNRVDQALAWARHTLAHTPDVEALDAPILLAHVLGVDRVALIAHPERPLTPAESAQFCALIERRAAGEPVPYLTGRRAFFDQTLIVTPDVLIPRPETEHLIEAALDWARGRDPRDLRIADIGTGSGAIAVTLAAHLPGAHLWAVDVSAAALDVARKNAARAGVEVAFLHGDLLGPLRDQPLDLIAANLPYIPRADLDALPVAQHEPRLALDGGPDGLGLIRRLLDQAPPVLAPGGLLLLEIMAGQGAAVTALARAAFPGADVRVIPDLAGHDRVVRVALHGGNPQKGKQPCTA